jgi:uncharacterized repeat protein (TIGR01451 family)/choice-of-anchor A domain-containing protein
LLEALEDRCLLSQGAFLQGFTFVDANHNGVFDSGEGQANNTIQLFAADLATAHLYSPSADLTTVLGTTTSNSIGYYIFTDNNVLTNNLHPGNYRLVETPIAGFANNDVDISDAQVYPATRVNSSTIQVTLVDPALLTDHFHGVGPGAIDSPTLNGTPLPGFTGQLVINLMDDKSLNTPNFFSYCLDLTQSVSTGAVFPVQPNPITSAFPNGGEIAYLYNHFGTSALSNTDAEALQEAMWELIYGSAFVPDLSHPGVAAAYSNFLTLAQGTDEAAVFLNAGSPMPAHGQSMIATGSLNFSNVSQIVTPTISTVPGGTVTIGSGNTLTDSAMLSGGFNPTGTITFSLFNPSNTAVYTDVVTVNGNGTYNTSMGSNPGGYLPTVAGTYQWVVTYSGDANNNGASSPLGSEPESAVTPPQLTITKTADQSTITAGQTAGFVITITNTGGSTATGLSLSDPLPAGVGNDINWMIDTSGMGLGTGTNPADFQISGAVGSQNLGLSSFFVTMGDSLAAGQSISVHITGLTSTNDLTSSTNPALGGAGNYAVLYTGTGGHNLSITNVTINGNVGVGGTGVVQFSGPGTIAGRLDFSAPNSGQFHNNNGSNVGPTSVNYNVAAVTAALNTVTTLSNSLAGLGNNVVISGNQTINESAGQLDTVGGVNYRVFNVTSYSENDGKMVTINGDGSGDPVVFNFGVSRNVNLGGDVTLNGGLSDDQVLWNFTSSGFNISLNNNASSYPLPLAFHGVIMALRDKISLTNANLSGRVFGGNSSDMQIVSGDTINAPPSSGTLVNTAVVTADGLSSSQASATITILAATTHAGSQTSSQTLGSAYLSTGPLQIAEDWLGSFPTALGQAGSSRKAVEILFARSETISRFTDTKLFRDNPVSAVDFGDIFDALR